MSELTEFQLSNPPTDGISHLVFSPNPNTRYLLASSWDTNVYFYDVLQNKLVSSHQHTAPVLTCAFTDENHVLSGGLSRQLIHSDLSRQHDEVIGSHDDAIKCINYSPALRCFITGSWDKTIRVSDFRQSRGVGTYIQSEKVITMDLAGEVLVVGTAQKNVLIWDLRNMSSVQQRRISTLKYQTRCLRCFPNEKGYVMSSTEGRVAVEYLSGTTSEEHDIKDRYAFKCHRVKEGGKEYIYPVYSISFHQQHNTFATGGGDGLVNVWDRFNKKRLCQFAQYPADISSLSFHPDGTQIAIASSCVYPELGKDYPKDTIYVRKVGEMETKPKKPPLHK
ncbi:Mitotic checkpoint protein BUB3 [Oopsacas minuta]|uniref:Mitotic checkpoint protein BUB3 n=1 Tax=Oopsacas minuta TaxID=111878 RepID=A0AAV7K5C7_9METZ|nr:Mitotic checkpoint protein BUB3 [Oopsacas minuta]